MFLLIANKKYIEPIKRIISDRGDALLFCDEGDDIDVIEDIEEVSDMAGKYLIYDSTLDVDLDELLLSLEKLRFKKERLQYIVLAPDKQKGEGDVVISRLVQFGIYNILNFSSEDDIYATLNQKINTVIDTPMAYKDVVSWDNNKRNKVQDTFLGSPFTSKKSFEQVIEDSEKRIEKAKKDTEIVEKTVTVIRDNLLGKVTIAIAGTMHHIGVTHFSVMAASYLKDLKFKVAVLELHESTDFETLSESFNNVIKNGRAFLINDIDFYCYSSISITELMQENYDYIVLDMGIFESCKLDEFKRADKRILISGAKAWEIPYLEKILKQERKYIERYDFLFNFSSNEDFRFIRKNMNGLNVKSIPYSPNPFNVGKDNEITSIFEKIVPEQNAKKGISINLPFKLPFARKGDI